MRLDLSNAEVAALMSALTFYLEECDVDEIDTDAENVLQRLEGTA